MTGYAGLLASSQLVRERREELRTFLPEHFLKRLEQTAPFLLRQTEEQTEEILRRQPSSCGGSGVKAALWELGEATQQAGFAGGLEAELDRIPIRQETIEICEALELDPYALPSGGRLFLLPDGLWSGAAVIGHLTGDKARVILTLSGRQYLPRPADHSACHDYRHCRA